MKESLRKMIGAASTLFLIGLFVVVAAPARAEGVGDRITALEEELTQLKGEQVQMREDALAAKAKLPTFRYKTRGLRITAADKSWGWRMFGRHVVFIYNNTDGNAGNKLDNFIMKAFEPPYPESEVHMIVEDDFDRAVSVAKTSDKLLLLNFTGLT